METKVQVGGASTQPPPLPGLTWKALSSSQAPSLQIQPTLCRQKERDPRGLGLYPLRGQRVPWHPLLLRLGAVIKSAETVKTKPVSFLLHKFLLLSIFSCVHVWTCVFGGREGLKVSHWVVQSDAPCAFNGCAIAPFWTSLWSRTCWHSFFPS